MAEKLQKAQADALRAFNADFTGNLPELAAKSGHYDAQPDDRFRKRIPAPDGRYRVLGSDWVIAISRGKFLDAARVAPPEFGGDYITIE